jgi:hypothetical protein
MKDFATSLSLRSFFQLQAHEGGMDTCQKLFPFSRFAFIQANQRDPDWANKLQIWINIAA